MTVPLLAATWLGTVAPASMASPISAIVPGSGIGHVRLGEDLADVTRALGFPQYGDAASGHRWSTWFGAHGSGSELDVYTDDSVNYSNGRANVRNRSLVQQVRTTSSWFRIGGDVGVGASLSQVRRRFPGIVRVGYPGSTGRTATDLYDDRRDGVAFQISRPPGAPPRCVSVIIHPRGRSVVGEYYPPRPQVLWYRRGSDAGRLR